MRGLSKAATLVLAPAAVLTRPVPTNPSSRDVPTESAFSVAVYVDTSASGHTGTTDQTLVFNLDIQEAPEACAPANVRIDGFLLAQDDTGAGQGTFASLDGHTVTASWNFSCSERTKTRRRLPPWDQDLAFTIMSLDGEAVPATASFVTSFRQQAPVKVYDIGGDAVVYTTEGHAPSRQHQRRLLDRIKSITGLPEVDCETRADVGDIVSLETQMRDLGERIKVKQSRILDRLGIRVPTPTPALNMQGFYQTAKLASSTLRGTMEHWLGSVLGFPVLRYDDYRHRHQPGQQLAHPEHRDDGLVVSMQVDGQGGQHFYYYRDEADSSSTRLTPTPPPRNVSYLPLFAIIFTFHLALYFVLRSIRQRTPSRCSSQQTPSSHHHRRSTQRQQRSSSSSGSSNEEQQQQSTASLLRESVRDLFRSRRNEFEEVVDEKMRLRMMYEDEYNNAATTTTSMEDELASFQEAAELFGGVVAAQARPREEEGGGDDDDDEDGRLPPRFAENVSPPAYDEVHKGGVW
ncbi:hypothetical protein BBK36DRAFT_22472 [Trichoderma citrinoviride]|uniref:Uncharacterized protein n=1 Tax=Trichoderma citrinoviride TaxID=58853 RepID=A0A2T4B3S9_9HYPO|nr:hypothetical protein BBK36DRAFT_22472 [Trichoderma citrinoviride]PTB63979.1 hypothetical protein BBK36DRAFT_22472 [Trichoderma citrinoviride]